MRTLEISLLLCCVLRVSVVYGGGGFPDPRPRSLVSRSRRSRSPPVPGISLSNKPQHSTINDGEVDQFDHHAAAQSPALTFASPPLGGDPAFGLSPSTSLFGSLPSYANGQGLTYPGAISRGADSFLPNFNFPNFGNFPQFGSGAPGSAKPYIPPVSKVLKEGINAFVPAGAQKYTNPVPVGPPVTLPKPVLPDVLPEKPPPIHLPPAQKPGGTASQFDVFRQVAVNPLQKTFSASLADPSLSPLPLPKKEIPEEESIQLIKRVEHDLLEVEKTLTPEERKTKAIYEAIDGISSPPQIIKEVVTVSTVPRTKIHAADTVGHQNIGEPDNYVSHDGFPIQSNSKLSPLLPTSPASQIPHKYAKTEHGELQSEEHPFSPPVTQPPEGAGNFFHEKVKIAPEDYFEDPTLLESRVELESDSFIRPGSKRGKFYPLNGYKETLPHGSPKGDVRVDSTSFETKNFKTYQQNPHSFEKIKTGSVRLTDRTQAPTGQDSYEAKTREKLPPIEYKQFAYENGVQPSDLDPHSKVLQSFGLRPLPKPPQVEPPELLSGPELLTLVQKSNSPVSPGIPAEKLLAIASTTVNSVESFGRVEAPESHNKRISPPGKHHPQVEIQIPKKSNLQDFPFADGDEQSSSISSVPYGRRTPAYSQEPYLKHQVSKIVNSHEIPTNVSRVEVWLHDNPQNGSKVPHISDNYNYAPEYQVRTYDGARQYLAINETFITSTDPPRGRLDLPRAVGNFRQSSERKIPPNGRRAILPSESAKLDLHEGYLPQPPGHISGQAHTYETPGQFGQITTKPPGELSNQKSNGHLGQHSKRLFQAQGIELEQSPGTVEILPTDSKAIEYPQITFERPPLRSYTDTKHLDETDGKDEEKKRLSVPPETVFQGAKKQELYQTSSRVPVNNFPVISKTLSSTVRKNKKDPTGLQEPVKDFDITSYLFPRPTNVRLSNEQESVIPDFDLENEENVPFVPYHRDDIEAESQLASPIDDFKHYEKVLRFDSAGHSKKELSLKSEPQTYEPETRGTFSSRPHEKNRDFELWETVDPVTNRNAEHSSGLPSLENRHGATTSYQVDPSYFEFSPEAHKDIDKNVDLSHQNEGIFRDTESIAEPKLKFSPETRKFSTLTPPRQISTERNSHLKRDEKLRTALSDSAHEYAPHIPHEPHEPRAPHAAHAPHEPYAPHTPPASHEAQAPHRQYGSQTQHASHTPPPPHTLHAPQGPQRPHTSHIPYEEHALTHEFHVPSAKEHATLVRYEAPAVKNVPYEGPPAEQTPLVPYVTQAVEHAPHVKETVEHTPYVEPAIEHTPHVEQDVEHALYVEPTVEYAPHVKQVVEHAPHAELAIEHAPYVEQDVEHALYVEAVTKYSPYETPAVDQYAPYVESRAEHSLHTPYGDAAGAQRALHDANDGDYISASGQRGSHKSSGLQYESNTDHSHVFRGGNSAGKPVHHTPHHLHKGEPPPEQYTPQNFYEEKYTFTPAPARHSQRSVQDTSTLEQLSQQPLHDLEIENLPSVSTQTPPPQSKTEQYAEPNLYGNIKIESKSRLDIPEVVNDGGHTTAVSQYSRTSDEEEHQKLLPQPEPPVLIKREFVESIYQSTNPGSPALHKQHNLELFDRAAQKTPPTLDQRHNLESFERVVQRTPPTLDQRHNLESFDRVVEPPPALHKRDYLESFENPTSGVSDDRGVASSQERPATTQVLQISSSGFQVSKEERTATALASDLPQLSLPHFSAQLTYRDDDQSYSTQPIYHGNENAASHDSTSIQLSHQGNKHPMGFDSTHLIHYQTEHAAERDSPQSTHHKNKDPEGSDLPQPTHYKNKGGSVSTQLTHHKNEPTETNTKKRTYRPPVSALSPLRNIDDVGYSQLDSTPHHPSHAGPYFAPA